MRTAPLDATSWDAFAALVERNNGVWGGCWCIGFHAEGCRTAEENRAAKQARVDSGDTHAALVLDGDDCLGWCQFGAPEELPRIKARRAYEAEPVATPDWRITCFFTDKKARGRGVAGAALAGALELIAQAGGGRVESFPEDVAGRKTSSSFLHNGTLELFERHGFARERRLGKHRWLVGRTVDDGHR